MIILIRVLSVLLAVTFLYGCAESMNANWFAPDGLEWRYDRNPSSEFTSTEIKTKASKKSKKASKKTTTTRQTGGQNAFGFSFYWDLPQLKTPKANGDG